MYANEVGLLAISLVLSGLISYVTVFLPKHLRWLALLVLLVVPSLGIWLGFQSDYPVFSKIVGLTILATILVNSIRVYRSNYSDSYLLSQTKHTLFSILALVLFWAFANLFVLTYDFRYYALVYSYLALLLSLLGFYRIYQTLFINQLRSTSAEISQSPTVTIAIPARNEDAVLEASLHQHLKSTYPRLEIIVLDDCSQDSTAEIIKSFAHQGIRFINGKDPRQGWLGKNYAYQQLLEAATGEIILFCGVDIRLSPEAVSELVARLRQGQYKMLSVLPNYQPAAPTHELWEIAQQTARYTWHLGISGLFSKTPTVVGSCWLADRVSLQKLGGFKSIKKMTEPSRFFARKFSQSNDYGFTASSRLLAGVTSTKRAKDQFLHILRVAYPLQSRDVTSVFLGILVLVMLILVPYMTVPLLLFAEFETPAIQLLGIAGLALIASYVSIYYYTSRTTVWLAPLVLPVVTIQTMTIMVWSMMKYEFSEIEWKGRNVCIPPLALQLKRPKKKRFGRRRRRRN